MNYVSLPKPASTQQERIDALKAARSLLSETKAFSSSSVDVLSLMRLGEYITTGHDYLDTHSTPEEDAK